MTSKRSTKSRKQETIDALAAAFRESQNRSQVFDQAAARKLGVNLTDLLCMDILQRRGRLSAGELAAEVGLTTGAVTAIVDRLSEAGYVERLHDDVDRRRVFIVLTQRALDAVAEIWSPMAMDWHEYMDRWTTAELERVLKFVRGTDEVVARHLDRVQGDAPKS